MDLFNKDKVKQLEQDLTVLNEAFNSEVALSEAIWTALCLYRHHVHRDVYLRINGEDKFIGFHGKYMRCHASLEKLTHIPREVSDENVVVKTDEMIQFVNGL